MTIICIEIISETIYRPKVVIVTGLVVTVGAIYQFVLANLEICINIPESVPDYIYISSGFYVGVQGAPARSSSNMDWHWVRPDT